MLSCWRLDLLFIGSKRTAMPILDTYVNLRKGPMAKVVRIVKGMVRLDMGTISMILWLKEATLHLHHAK